MTAETVLKLIIITITIIIIAEVIIIIKPNVWC